MGLAYQIGYHLSKAIAEFCFGFEVIHQERIPETGGAILAMNHQSFFDPPLGGIACKREIFFLARKSLLKWPLLGPIFPKLNVVPVEQERADMSALKTVIKHVQAGQCTVVFPEGTRSRDGSLQAAQPGIGLILAKTRVPVVPMRIFGAYEVFPRRAKFPRPGRITVVVGEPFEFTDADFENRSGRELYQYLSEKVMERIAAIDLPERVF